MNSQQAGDTARAAATPSGDAEGFAARAGGSRDAGAGPSVVDPDGTPRPITPITTEADLVRRYGRENVVPQEIPVGEGETMPGVVIHPADSTRRLEVIWSDSAEPRTPRHLILRGPGNRWRVEPGVAIGTSLEELERLNGGPFTLLGWGWDYGGTVASWKGGRLEDAWGDDQHVVVRLGAPLEREAEAQAFSGDREFPSDDPRMRRINPVVYEILVSFE